MSVAFREIRALCHRLGLESVAITRVPNGRHDLFRVQSACGRYALKVLDSPASQRERRARELQESGLPLPALADAGDLPDGRGFLLMEWRAGAPMTEVLGANSMAQRQTAFASAANHLRRLHAVERPQAWTKAPPALLAFGRPGFLDLLSPSLTHLAAHFGAALAGDVRSALAGLRLTEATETRITTSHGDYQPKNLLIDATGQVTCILDWEFCGLAPHWSDLAHLLRASPDEATDERIGRGYGVAEPGWTPACRSYDLARICLGLGRPDLEGDDLDDWALMVEGLVRAIRDFDVRPAREAAAALRAREAA